MDISAPGRKSGARGTLPAADRARLTAADRLVRECRFGEAEGILRQVLQRHPASFDALVGLASFVLRIGRRDEAITLLRSALQIDPRQGDVLFMLGQALHAAGEAEAASACVDMAIDVDPDDDALRLRAGAWLVHVDRLDAARQLLEPLRVREERSMSDARWAGRAARVLGDDAKALRCLERAARSTPPDASVLVDFGSLLTRLRRSDEAIGAFRRALALDRSSLRAHVGLGQALAQALRFDEALESIRQGLRIDGHDEEAIGCMGYLLRRLGRDEDAALAYERLLTLRPEGDFVRGQLLDCKMGVCDWLDLEPLLLDIERELDRGAAAATPFAILSTCRSAARMQAAARLFAKRPGAEPPVRRVWLADGRIRIGYVGEPAQGRRLAEAHDRSRFEAFAFADAAAADDSEVDVLVNLDREFEWQVEGFRRSRAPVRVNLGFPGTLGVGCFDALIADGIVAPPTDAHFYDEALVQMPGCHLPVCAPPTAAPVPPGSRTAQGLPESGFVFCCVSGFRMVTPEVFRTWMQLLGRLPGSVLWLPPGDGAVVANLVAEAVQSDVVAERLVFARPDPGSGRSLALADLVLDTWPCNAALPAADALAAGVPIVSCTADTFGGRIGASLLQAVGLERLAMHSLREYEAVALRLASDPGELADLRAHLARPGVVAPLFGTDGCVRRLEAVYERIAAQAGRGLRPSTVVVET